MLITAIVKRVMGRLFRSEAPQGIRLHSTGAPRAAHAAYACDLRYRVGNGLRRTAARVSSGNEPAASAANSTLRTDQVPEPPSQPATPAKAPGTVIAFPTRSNQQEQPPTPGKAPGEVVVFPSRSQYSSPNYELLDRVFEQLLAEHEEHADAISE